MLSNQTNHPQVETTTSRYVPPAVIYQGQISTRAGSPIGPIAPSDDRDVDPVDLFASQSAEQ